MLFFFFQAEDGIRDSPVTGVQTCALPICGKFVVMICDGIDKYRKNFEKIGNIVTPAQVSQEEVASKASEYDKVIWVHTQYTPREEGIEILAKSLGIDKSKIVVPNARTAQQLLSGQQVPEEIDRKSTRLNSSHW